MALPLSMSESDDEKDQPENDGLQTPHSVEQPSTPPLTGLLANTPRSVSNPFAAKEDGTISSDVGIVPTMPVGVQRLKANHEADDSGYRPVGRLTFEDVMNNEYEVTYAPLEKTILKITERIQKDMTGSGHMEDTQRAREGDEVAKRRMSRYIDSEVVSTMGALGISIPPKDTAIVAARVVSEIVGSGPLEPLLANPEATEIMVSGPTKIYVELKGRLQRVPGVGFRDAKHALELANRILQISGRTISEKVPLADGRLQDMSRFNAVHTVIASDGPYLTIRRARTEIWTVQELVDRNSMTADIATELVNLIYAGCTTVIVGGTGTGKALNVNTLIPTPKGFVKMGDLKTGDEVLDEKGKPTTITAIYDQGVRPSYNVHLTDGTIINADAEHNWLTYDRAARRSISRRNTNGTTLTEETLAHLKEWHASLEEEAQLSIKCVTERFPELNYRSRACSQGLQATRIDNKHYFDGKTLLGRIIKAGSRPPRSQKKRWTEPAVRTTSEIAQHLHTKSGHVNHAVPALNQPVEYPAVSAVSAVSAEDAYAMGTSLLEELPASTMLTSSIEQRRALLSGVADTYGKLSGINGTISIPLLENKNVAKYIHSIALSLGMYANLRETDSFYTLQLRTQDKVFSKGMKEAKMHALVSPNLTIPAYRYIEDIVLAEEAEMRCITVDGENHLFLCGTEYVVTHNTTVLNALSGAFPPGDAIITIEDNFELKLHPDRNVRAEEARPPNASGEGEISIRQLVRNALRMRPDRIVVGEVRGGEAFDMLQAMNTGHEGSMTTFHANGPDEAIDRLASMTAQAGEVDKDSAMSLIASGVDLMLTIDRYDDGSRRISGIYEIPIKPEVIGGGTLTLTPIPIWEFEHQINHDNEEVVGEYVRANEISDRLIKRKRLHTRRQFTTEEAYQISDLGQD